MTIRSHGLKGVASIGLAAVICGALLSCSGPVGSPEESGGKAPDLLVTSPSVSDSGPDAGTKFTLSATVRNAGDGAAAATTLRYYRSTDAAITRSDTEVGTDEVAALAASGTGRESVELVAPSTPGAYYYGACVDAVTAETDATDNCSTSVKVTVQATVTEPQGRQEQQDLVVMSPSVSDSAPAAGTEFTLSVAVSNAGGEAAAATAVRYYQSPDATITTSDTEVGTDAVAELAPSGSGSQSVELTAPSTPGTYYYGACVDAVADESDMTNNCSTSAEVTVPAPRRPDLVVTSPSVSDSRPVTGTSFTLSATVSNDGDGSAAATTVRYYRSTDATITTSDRQVGTDAVAELAAAGSGSQSVDLVAPSTQGTYYYGACVDAVADESDTTNNCSASVEVSVQVTVTESQGHPDLTVTSPSVSDTRPVTGTSFTLSATVNNDGDGTAAATTVRYYRSTDATITTSDTQVGTDSVGALAALGSSAESISLTAPATAGAYYYGACVDAVTDESDPTDNCSASVKVDVEEPTHPDLEVGTPTVDDTSPETGATLTLSATVSNTGDGRSAAATLRYYRSTDGTITRSDTQVGTDSVGALAASGSSAESISLTAPATAGAYYYGACVDAVTAESDTTDNCSTSVKVDVEEPTYPDLEVGTPRVDNTSPETGATLTLSATVGNTGDGESAATTLRYYRSTDATIATSDTQVGTDSVGALAASGSSAESISLTAPATAGAYYYGACVDAVTAESDTTDNCSTSVKVDVEEPQYADLEVGTPTVDDASPDTGATFTLSATVINTGGGESAATTLRYYRSTDATITTSDTSVGTDSISGLAAAGTSHQSVDLTAPDIAGKYYYGACVDAVTDESDTTNNCSGPVTVTVTAPETGQSGPSVEVTAEDDMEWAPVGDTVDLTASVLDEEGEELSGATVAWTSSNTDVATVNSSGVMTAVGVGRATVTATATVSSSSTQSVTARSRVSGGAVARSAENVSDSIEIEVVQRASRIEVSPDSLSFDEVGEGWVGSLKSVTATVYDADDNEMQPTYWSWSSSDEDVVTVRPFGAGTALVQALWIGSATLTVTANASATVTVTVTATVTLPGGRVQLEPRSLTFDALGDTKSVTVRIFDEDGEEDEAATFNHSTFFTPSTGGSIGSGRLTVTKVAGGLQVTANQTGTANVEVYSRVHSYGLKVTVTQKPTSLEVSPDSVSLAVGGTSKLTARIKDSNGHSTQLASGDQEGLVVSWATSNSAVASVDGADDSSEGETGATATVTAVAAGSATITASWGSGIGRVTDTATVTASS